MNPFKIKVILVLFVTLHGAILTAATDTPTRPNILFIAVDDLNDYVGCLGGHPNGFTPHIDALAQSGTLFTNAHAPAPVCNPSRAAFLTGLMPSSTGIYHNKDRWDEGGEELNRIAHLPLHFRRAGYQVLTGGKIFHTKPQNYEEGFDQDAGGFGGFNLNLQSAEFSDPFEGLGGAHTWAFHWGPLDEEQSQEMSDQKLAAWAAGQLRQPSEKPFLLMVGFHRPHTPLTSPKPYWDLFDREALLLPPTNVGDLDDMPWMGRQVAVAGWQEMEKGHYRMVKERGVHEDILHAYLAASAYVDDQIGKVINALDSGPHRDNTIVVLFSDHGWAIGEHYHFKKWALWDDTTRVPMIIRLPGDESQPQTTDAGVTLTDIYPTLVDLADIAPPAHKLDGRSLKPLLEDGDEASWTRPALTTFGPGNHALRTPRWRYIRWADGSEELYDHATDPHEWHNVAGLPRWSQIKEDLAEWLPETDAPAVASSHASPVTLNAGQSLLFHTIEPDFVEGPIHIEAQLKRVEGDGEILEHSGMFSGYRLHVRDGRLAFTLKDVPSPLNWNTLESSETTLSANDPLPLGVPLQVAARLDQEGKLTLSTNGEVVAQGQLGTLSIHPAGSMRVPPEGKGIQVEEVTVEFGSKNKTSRKE